MIKKIKLTWFIALLIQYLSGCIEEPESHSEIYLKNNSQERIYFQTKKLKVSTDTLLKSPPNFSSEYKPYYDSIIWKNNSSLDPGESTRIFFEDNSCYEYLMNDHSRVYYAVAILEWNTISANEWNTICKYDMVVKRYLINLDFLEKNNYTIPYP
jgi:hypothetical protein